MPLNDPLKELMGHIGQVLSKCFQPARFILIIVEGASSEGGISEGRMISTVPKEDAVKVLAALIRDNTEEVSSKEFDRSETWKL